MSKKMELVEVFSAFANLVNGLIEEDKLNPKIKKKVDLLGRRLNRFSKQYGEIVEQYREMQEMF